MKVMIVYGTYSGGTLHIAEEIKSVLQSRHEVKLYNVMDVKPYEFKSYDLIILGSCSWLQDNKDGQPHQGFITLFDALRSQTFADKRFAIFGLGDSHYLHFCGAVGYLSTLVENLKGRNLINPLRIDRYYFNEMENIQSARKWAEELDRKL